MILTNDRDPKNPATTVDCPDCNGEGEIHTDVTRSEWGVWESKVHTCVRCSGTGAVLAECSARQDAAS